MRERNAASRAEEARRESGEDTRPILRRLADRTFGSGVDVFLSIRRFPVIVVLGLAFASLATLHMASAGVAGLEPARFVPAAGWHLRQGVVHACVGVSASRCSQAASTASTTRWRDCIDCLPHRTVAAMRANDIAIRITIVVERPLRLRRTFAWPPRVRRRSVYAPFEGLPGRIGVYQGNTRIGGREVFVFIVFGRAVPTNRQLNRANAELRRARLG